MFTLSRAGVAVKLSRTTVSVGLVLCIGAEATALLQYQ